MLEYKEWRNFQKATDKVIISCVNSDICLYNQQFVMYNKPIRGGNGNIQLVDGFRLSRYACYLIVQNGDSKKKAVALGQTYFAIQTRKMELTEEEYSKLSEDEKKIIQKNKLEMEVIKVYIMAKQRTISLKEKVLDIGKNY